jgi:hypothetical protein
LFEQKCLLFLYFVYTYIDNYVNDHNAIFLSYIDDTSYREKNYRKKIVSTNSRIVPPLTHIIINVKKIIQLECILSLFKHQVNVLYVKKNLEHNHEQEISLNLPAATKK